MVRKNPVFSLPSCYLRIWSVYVALCCLSGRIYGRYESKLLLVAKELCSPFALYFKNSLSVSKMERLKDLVVSNRMSPSWDCSIWDYMLLKQLYFAFSKPTQQSQVKRNWRFKSIYCIGVVKFMISHQTSDLKIK